MFVVFLVAAAPATAQAQWLATGYVDNNVAGDVQSGRLGAGVSAGYFLGGQLGLELDAELHGHFFRDEDVAALVPAGVDLNTRAALASGNIVLPYCVHGAAGTWCPYATAGLGVIHAMFEGIAHAPGTSNLDRAQTNLAWNAGIGVMHALTRWVGFRVDARYLHALVDESSTSGGYFKDYGYCRISVGVTFGGDFVSPQR
jgi:Outer membrane protein beta-barrel domain